jgi:hypothetical protein
MTRAPRLDRLVGRIVHTMDGRRVGRLEAFTVRRHDDTWFISAYMIGVIGLLERLGVGSRLILGRAGGGGYVARWDQMDLTDPDRPRLTCDVDALERVVQDGA